VIVEECCAMAEIAHTNYRRHDFIASHDLICDTVALSHMTLY